MKKYTIPLFYWLSFDMQHAAIQLLYKNGVYVPFSVRLPFGNLHKLLDQTQNKI